MDGEIVICFVSPFAALAIVNCVSETRCGLKTKCLVERFDVIKVCSGWSWRRE
jgi:hypothetical protein